MQTMSHEESGSSITLDNVGKGGDDPPPQPVEKTREQLLREELAKYASEAVEAALLARERTEATSHKKGADQIVSTPRPSSPKTGTLAGEYIAVRSRPVCRERGRVWYVYSPERHLV